MDNRLVITFADETQESFDRWKTFTVAENGQVLVVEFTVGSMENPRCYYYPLSALRSWKTNP